LYMIYFIYKVGMCMKNKGFTLIELIASIAILAMLSTIIVVAVSKSINKAKEDANTTMMKAIRLAAEDYAINNEGILTEFSTNDWVDIKLETLIKNNYFDNELKDFVTKENIPITNIVRVTRSFNGKVTSTYTEDQTTKTTITLNGSYNTYVKKGDTYEDEGVIATTPEGVNVTSSVVKSGTVNTNTLGTYVLTYTYQDVSITRNVIVSETDNLVSNWHTITINPNGGTYSGSTSNTIYSIKEGRTQTIAIPTKPDFTFTSWTKTCTACYNTSTRVYTVGTANDTLTAGWQQNANINLTVNLNGGSTTQTFNATYPINSTLTLTVPTKSGSVFAGWTATTTGGSSVSGNTLTIGTRSITLTATWLTYATMFTYTGTSEVVDDTGGNWRIIFKTSGTFTPLVDMAVNIHLIGGGGGGGVSSSGYLGGGGGSAGYSNFIMTSIPLTKNTPYAVVVGAGGASNTNGNQSYFISTTYAAAGGNKGSGSTGASGGSGAGGGGGYSYDYNAGTGGSYGGNCIAGGSRSALGGTGQGWTSCEFGLGTTTGCNAGITAYGGGGSGGAGKSYGGTPGPQIAGGYPGGGAGGRAGAGVAGVANTGGGGGGGGYSGYAGGAGGSGIVIIRNHR
jgi:prepilin-type N-terminal cleavage/methylation domain-containing protein/uncharacterized repeat protein (TIGR02543 family)